MTILIAWIQALYLPMLPYTLLVLGTIGLGTSLYTHELRFILYSLLLGLPLNMVVIVVYLKYFAQF